MAYALNAQPAYGNMPNRFNGKTVAATYINYEDYLTNGVPVQPVKVMDIFVQGIKLSDTNFQVKMKFLVKLPEGDQMYDKQVNVANENMMQNAVYGYLQEVLKDVTSLIQG